MPHKNHHESVATLLGQPALVQLLEKTCSDKSDKDRKVLREKIETQCKSFEGKGKLTVDDLYGVIKLQVNFYNISISLIVIICEQMKVDVTKDDIRKAIVDLPMDKNYKISGVDFCRTPILSDEVFKLMDKNNDGQISKGELKLARKQLTLKQIDALIHKLDKDGNGTISLDELKAAE